MKQVTITTGKVTIVVVDLPIGAFDIKVDKGHIKYNNSKFSDIISPAYLSQKKEGEWKYAGTPSQLTEEDWKGIVESRTYLGGLDMYLDYGNDPKYRLNTATESGLSLLKANGVVMENTMGKQTKCDCEFNCPGEVQEECYSNYLEWQKAQEQVWLNPQIFVKL